MAKLDRYRAKRDFMVTRESPPIGSKAPRAAGPLTFMVHKHHARRLHYDLRLEIEGVLASWAVPRGPSSDPSQKRRAVETEEHPLACVAFEGRIPEGEYGAGDTIIWDHGTWNTFPPGRAVEQKRKGHLVLELRGEKLRGQWHLVRTERSSAQRPSWLLFKAKEKKTPARTVDLTSESSEWRRSGRCATREPVAAQVLRASHPYPLDLLVRVWPPMSAVRARARDIRTDDFLEVKYGGLRTLSAISGARVALQSRNALDLSMRFPTITSALSKLVVGEAVLDGEIVVRDRGARFQALQNSSARVEYAVFDLLWLEGEDLRGRALEERRERLESLLSGAPESIRLAERIEGTLEQALAKARREGWEGIVAKRSGSTYQGRRSRDWLKLKRGAGQELVIIGYTPISTGGEAIGALLLGIREGGEFVYAGKAGTGYTERTRRDLFRRLERERVEAPQVTGAPRMRDARWVKPRLVAKIDFAEWTSTGKLRHPSVQGLREDKRPEKVVREWPESS